MDADHDRFATLAVGHVLGGLTGSDARRFESHLRGCVDCRTRVAELRDIADELEAAEADERSRVPVRTEVERREPDDEVEVTPTRSLTVGHVTAAVVVVLLIAVGVLFWNLHLRTSVAGYDQLLSAQSEALTVLASGTSLPTDLADDVTGIVATDGERIAFTLAGLDVADDEVVAAWTVDAEGETTEQTRAPGALLRQGAFAAVVDRDGVVEVLVTLEAGPPGEMPEGETLARSQL